MNFKIVTAFCVLVSSALAETVITSPDGKIEVGLEVLEGVAHWRSTVDGVEVFKASPIRIFSGDKAGKAMVATSDVVTTSSYEETWKPTWGQFSEIKDHHNEAAWKITEETTIRVRVSDYGMAMRYEMPTSGKKVGDRTEIRFAKDGTFWGANNEKANHGPLKLSDWAEEKRLQAPMTIRFSDKLYLGVIEAGLYHQYPFHLQCKGGTTWETRSGQTSWGEKARSSWRTVLVGRSAGDLMVNPLIWNLNPKNKIADTSWIKPGFTLWDWRSWGAKAPDGFEYGLDMASWRRFIDFAAKHENVRYLMLDANWYGPEFKVESDPTKSRDHVLEQLPNGHIVRKDAPADWKDPIDVPGIIKYGNERGVGIILYINEKARVKHDFDKTLETYAKWGAAGIKYGFMTMGGDRKVQETRRIVELCAKHKLICDFHDGPIPGSGDERTWPNYMTREFCHAQSDAKRSFSPGHFVTTVFNNGMTGSLDMANGLYAIKDAEKVRPRIFQKVNTTVVGETARTLISYAAVAILPDIPEAYEAKADLFKFIESMPMTWDETLVMNAEIGKSVTVARRSGKRWWVGSATNEESRELTIDLSFLPAGSEWKATFSEDTAETHFETNPEAYKVRTAMVKAGDKVTIKLAPGGGHCLHLSQ